MQPTTTFFSELQHQENEIKELINEPLNESTGPKKETIQTILNFSKSLSVKKSKAIGNVELMLN